MVPILKIVTSTVGRKIIMALTALALCGFIAVHLIGNFTLYASQESQLFNLYAHNYIKMGVLLYVVEIALLALFCLHAFIGITIWWQKRKFRPQNYLKVAAAGGSSEWTFFSKNMIWTGVIMIVFLVTHLIQLKWGAYYTVTVEGHEIRDMYKLVVEFFGKPFNSITYVVIMLVLGFHLRHGFWSAFQSLGVSHPRYSPLIYAVGILFAIAMAFGFLAIPIWILITGGA